MSALPADDYEFALCLTHDVDRPYKTWQVPYYALRDRSLHHFEALLPGRQPWWQFEAIASVEERHGVRSAFYLLQEPHLFAERPATDWTRPVRWMEHLGRYDPTDPDLAATVGDLDDRGWEIGVHGSHGTHDDPERFRYEVDRIESLVGHPLAGGRQHWLWLDRPDTWRMYADAGLRYDSSLGAAEEYGFAHGYDPIRPFDDEFVVFPLTLMEQALDAPGEETAAAWREIESLLVEADENDAVMTVLWHLRYFDETDFPGYATLYDRLVERALEMGAWVGPPGDLYDRLSHPDAAGTPTPR